VHGAIRPCLFNNDPSLPFGSSFSSRWERQKVNHMTLATVRQWHSYIGLFIAPSVLFFALTGAAQIFNLHEAHGGYRPPEILEKLSSVHKDQVFAFGNHHAPIDPQASSARPVAGPGSQTNSEEQGDRTSLSTLLLKWFFLIVALCLVVSTACGIWMGLTQIRARRSAWVLLIAGTAIPVALLLV
jgi:hypothetical protein